MNDDAFTLSLTPAARRRLQHDPRTGLRLAAADAVTAFLTGPLLDNPTRSAPLRRELAGYHSTRRGPYRVVYRIEEDERVVRVLRIDHRADIYHRA